MSQTQAPGPREPWYKDGLQFSCTQCGNCCTGAPGYVYVTREEIERIAAFIGREGRGLTRTHVRRVGRRLSLTEDRRTCDCCFLERTDDGRRVCGIYSVRPLQCRTWPFWSVNLRSRAAWEAAARDCPGIGRGRRRSFVQIEIRRKANRWEDLSPCPTHSAK
ncbi:MAG: YkgJ family cysteine cluster protein [Phycisphaerae bacterium]